MKASKEEYDALCVTLEQEFSWIEKTPSQATNFSVPSLTSFQLKVRLGDLYDEIACYAEALPGPVTSPLHSFAGFVLNLNIAAKVHRDVEDARLCLILWAEICASTSQGLCFSCAPKMPLRTPWSEPD